MFHHRGKLSGHKGFLIWQRGHEGFPISSQMGVVFFCTRGSMFCHRGFFFIEVLLILLNVSITVENALK